MHQSGPAARVVLGAVLTSQVPPITPWALVLEQEPERDGKGIVWPGRHPPKLSPGGARRRRPQRAQPSGPFLQPESLPCVGGGALTLLHPTLTPTPTRGSRLSQHGRWCLALPGSCSCPHRLLSGLSGLPAGFSKGFPGGDSAVPWAVWTRVPPLCCGTCCASWSWSSPSSWQLLTLCSELTLGMSAAPRPHRFLWSVLCKTS